MLSLSASQTIINTVSSISYKLAIITYKTNSTKTPAYLSDIIHKYHPARTPRSALAPLQSGTHSHTAVDFL